MFKCYSYVKFLCIFLFVCLFVCFISTAALIIIIYIHFHYNVLGGYHVSDFKSLNDGLLLNYLYMLLILTVFIWQINVMLCYVKEMSHDFVRGQSVAETCFSHWG